jgi:hypothetical protein
MQSNVSSFLEGNFVLSQIDGRFIWVPLEFHAAALIAAAPVV